MAVIARRDIDKYVKFFCIKAAQTIIQSRSGEKLATRCNPETIGVDWFNIALPNGVIVSDVQNEIKTLYGRHCPAVRDSFFIDVILRTAEGLDMLVETWIVYATEKPDTNVKVCFTVYNKLAVLLKTLISFTRALPAYRVSRRRNKDFNFLYKIYSGTRKSGSYEDLSIQNSIGTVGTPFYSISIEVAYREVLHIDAQHATYYSPTALKRPEAENTKEPPLQEAASQGIVDQIAKAVSEDVISNTNSIPSSFSPFESTNDDNSLWMSKEIKDALGEIEFIDRSPSVSELSSKQLFGVEGSKGPFSSSAVDSGMDKAIPSNVKTVDPPAISQTGIPQGYSSAQQQNHEGHVHVDGFANPSYQPLAAFADFPTVNDSIASIPTVPSTPPLLSCLEEKMNFVESDTVSHDSTPAETSLSSKESSPAQQNSDNGSNIEDSVPTTAGMEGLPQAHAVGFEDDFVLVELRPAFSCKEGEAVSLFRDSQNPPPLDMFSTDNNRNLKGRTLKDILDSYEDDFKRFDKLFKKLGYLEVS